MEEIISPIPSFVVLIPAGAAAQLQEAGWWYLWVLALLAACGRIVASLVLYFVANKAEGWLFGRGRRLFGVNHRQLERYGKRFSGSSRDWLALFLFNAVPVMPTALLSLACGFIKINLKLFITATFIGSAVNAVIYMSLGYTGIQAMAALRDAEAVGRIALAVLALGILGWLLYRRTKT